MMGLVDLTKDLTYNSNFETEPVENQTGPEINSNFQTSNIENQDVVGTESSNIDGAYKGSVDFFPSPHGLGEHNIDGFVANVQPLSNGFYPNTIELGSVNFFPGGNFSNNFTTSTGFTQNAEPFGGSKIETEFEMIGEGNTLNQNFMSNELFQSINTLGTYKGAVDFISDTDSYATGFTKDFSILYSPVVSDDLFSMTRYDINKFYLDEGMNFSVTSGIPNPGLSIYSAGLESQYTTDAEGVNGDVSWNLKIGAAGLGDTPPPYDLNTLKGGLQNWNVATSGYLGEVNFFSDSDSYTTGFTKNMTFGTEFNGYYQIGSYYTDPNINQPFPTNGETTGFLVTNGTPNPGLSVYSAGLKSQYTSDAETVNSNVDWNLKIGAAGLGDTPPPYDLDTLKGGLQNWNIGNFDLGDFTVFGDNTTGNTSYGISDSMFITNDETPLTFSIDTKGVFQPGNVAGLLPRGDDPFTYNDLLTSMKSWNIGTSRYLGAVNFISNTDSYTSGFTKNFSVVHDSLIPVTLGDDGVLDLSSITKYDIDRFYVDKPLGSSFNIKGFEVSDFVLDSFNSIGGPTSYGLSPSIFTTDSDIFGEDGETVIGIESEFSVYRRGKFQPGRVAGLGEPGDNPFTFDDLKLEMNSWNVDGFNINDFTNFGDNVTGYTKGVYSLGESQFTFEDGAGTPKLRGIGYSGDFSSLSIGYSSIPSLSIPKPEYTATSGPFKTNSGYDSGDFELKASDQGFIPRYLQGERKEDETLQFFSGAEGTIVRDTNELNIRSGATTLKTLFADGEFILNNDGKGNNLGTKYRDISNMDAGDYGYPSAPFGYSDGVSTESKQGSMYGSFGLIDKKITEVNAGLTPDFFVRESGGGRFIGRIVKDLDRTIKRTLSPAGIMGLGKDAIMTLFNPSDNSIYTNLITRFTAGSLGQFGIRGSSVASNLLSLPRASIVGVPDDSIALYENRVNKKHPETNVGGISSQAVKDSSLITSKLLEGGRKLTDRYGQPQYPVHKPLSKATKAQALYGGGMLDPDSTRAVRGLDKINIKSYGDEYDGDKDLIKFNFKDIRNGKRIIFRAFLTNIQDSISPEWNNYRYIGRPDDVYVYKGTSRSISFSLKVAAFSRREMIPMWEKINYLVGLNYGSYVDTTVFREGNVYQNNPGMTSPICQMTIGDYVTDQPGYIKDFNISVPPDYPWDTIVDDGGKNVVGELPQVVDINMGFQVIPQQLPDSYGKHFGKVGLSTTEVGQAGLPWLDDLYNNFGALNNFKVEHEKYLSNAGVKLPSGGGENKEDITNTDEPKTKAEQGAQKGTGQ